MLLPLLPGVLSLLSSLLDLIGAASATAWILLALTPQLPGSYWCYLLYCLDPIGLPLLLPGSFWCCLRYCLESISAAYATDWILLVLPPATTWIILVLPPLMSGLYWCCLCYYLDHISAASAIVWILLVLPLLLPGSY
jgi:hypothetical protein